MSERFPRQFGKYVLLKSLARGGMGEIYLAASGQTGGLNKLCVIKKVITEKTDPAKVNRFLDEAKVVLRLSHANLVATFDAGDVSGELFIAMELVEGKDLREIWNRCVRTRTRIPVDVALVVGREIARALAYVHAYGGLRLVHRDVAPPNILLSYFGEVKLTDFGLARSSLKQEHTAPGVVFGRASYLAPEQARGELADARTDVYSLGIVLWELLTGQPYLQLAGLDPVTSLSLVRNPRPLAPSTRAPWLAPDLDAVVLKALAADREERFQSADELRRALSDAMVRVAPQADSECVANFLGSLYRDVLSDESTERERLLGRTLPEFRGDPPPDAGMQRTPPTTSIAHGVREAVRETSTEMRGSNRSRPTRDSAAATGLLTSPPTTEAAKSSPAADPPGASLHLAAHWARGDSTSRRTVDLSFSAETPGGDTPTNVWHKPAGIPDARTTGARSPAAGIASGVREAPGELPAGVRGDRAGSPVSSSALGAAQMITVQIPAIQPSRGWSWRMRILLLLVASGATALVASHALPRRFRDWIRGSSRSPEIPDLTSPSGLSATAPSRDSPSSGATIPAVTIASLQRVPGATAETTNEAASLERARLALVAGAADEAVASLRPIAATGNAAARPMLAEALVASGWKDVKASRWALASRKAREALALSDPAGSSHGAHALLGEILYERGVREAALAELTKALAESPGNPGLRRRVRRSRRQLRRGAAVAEPVDENESTASQPAAEQ